MGLVEAAETGIKRQSGERSEPDIVPSPAVRRFKSGRKSFTVGSKGLWGQLGSRKTTGGKSSRKKERRRERLNERAVALLFEKDVLSGPVHALLRLTACLATDPGWLLSVI